MRRMANVNAVSPTWSNDGNEIAYVSTDLASTDGHPDWKANSADIKVVAYQDPLAPQTGAPPAAVPLTGASDTVSPA